MRTWQGIVLWAGLIGLITADSAISATHYVNVSNATPSAPFLTWASAATNIQAAVDAAASGEEILVAPGNYLLSSGIQIPSDKTLALHSTEQNAAVLDAQGLTSVIQVDGTNSLVTGFTIQHGHPPGLGEGGGVWLQNGSVLRDCLVVSNHAYNGGGVYLCPPAVVENCTIQNNLADREGGGVYYNYLFEGAGIVRNCTIQGNVASNNGGGVECYGAGLISGCWISSNRAVNVGGGGADLGAGAWLVNNVLVSNQAPRGGGVFSYGAATNPAYVVNGTVLFNTASNMGGGIYAGNATRLANNIIYYNAAAVDPNLAADPVTCTVSNNCMPGSWGGTNFTNAPAFVDIFGQNFHLATASFCIDAGKADLAPVDDYDGRFRPLVGTPGGAALPDVGAFEYGFHFHDIQFISSNVFDLVWDEQNAGVYAFDISVPGLVSPGWTNLTVYTNTGMPQGQYAIHTLQITYSSIPAHAVFRFHVSRSR